MMERRPHLVEVVVVDAEVACAKILVGMNDDLEAVPMHAPALVAHGYVRQPVRGLEDVAAPDVGVSGQVEVCPLMRGALDADLLDARDVQVIPNPAGQVFIGRLLHVLVEKSIVELGNPRLQLAAQPLDLSTGKPRPPGRQCATHFGQEAVPVEPASAMIRRQDVDMARRLEAGRRGEQGLDAHRHTKRNRGTRTGRSGR